MVVASKFLAIVYSFITRGQRGFVWRPGEAAVGHRDPGGAEPLLDLVLEKSQSGIFPCFRGGRSILLSRSRRSERINTGRVCCGSITSSRKPRSAATYGLANRSV